MEKQRSPAWTAVVQSLETSALLPQQREEMIARALEGILKCTVAVGTALIWPCLSRKIPWKVYYAGMNRHVMLRWLSARLDSSLDVTMEVLQHDLTSSLTGMPPPLLMHVQAHPLFSSALWIVWTAQRSPTPLPHLINEGFEHVYHAFETLLEVESREELYFSASSPLHDRTLTEALSHGDTAALSVVLSLTRVIGKADLTYWGSVYHNGVEIVSHLGARQSDFGFALPLGRGITGRVAAYDVLIEQDDYRNSTYRDSSISDIIDREQIYSGLALPVHNRMAQVSAVLVNTRRTVTPFSAADRLLIQRLARSIEPLPSESRSPSFIVSDVQHHRDHKPAWDDIVLHANSMEVVEAWLSRIIKGPVIVTDGNDYPYVLAHVEELERQKSIYSCERDAVQVLPLGAPDGCHGKVYLWPTVPLPPPQWPDFFADIVIACNLVIARIDQAQDQLAHQREQWLLALVKGKSSQFVEQAGYRLGLPIEQGQVWVIAWTPEAMQAMKLGRKRMIAENVVLDTVKSPLTFFDGVGVVLLREPVLQTPSRVRDALLNHCGLHPVWIVHGARYHSLPELKMTLTHAIATAQKARREGYGEYLLDSYTFGLDSLLENPRLVEDLNTFATRLLAPLIEHDAEKGSSLTETFVLAQKLGSAQAVAEHLDVHINTIRNRLHRAKAILGTDQPSPKENAGMVLAAFIWTSLHMPGHTIHSRR